MHFICLLERQRKTERELLPAVLSPNAHKGQSWALGTPYRSLLWLAGVQPLQQPLTASQMVPQQRAGIRSGAKTWTQAFQHGLWTSQQCLNCCAKCLLLKNAVLEVTYVFKIPFIFHRTLSAKFVKAFLISFQL